MVVSDSLIRQAIESLSQVDGLFMNEKSLVEDVVLLAYAFPEDGEFMAACASTKRSIEYLVRNKVTAACLKYEWEGWQSYHYQHRARQGAKATCRIVYRRIPEGIEVKGFGHRRIPRDFYERMSSIRLEGKDAETE